MCGRHPPPRQTTPQADIPPGPDRHPLRQISPWAETPQADAPPRADTPRQTPPGQTPPPKSTVSILLKCIFVYKNVFICETMGQKECNLTPTCSLQAGNVSICQPVHCGGGGGHVIGPQHCPLCICPNLFTK